MPPLTPELVLTSILGVIAFAFLVTGVIRRAQRVVLFVAALFAAGAAGAAWVASFWPMVSLALLSLSIWFATIEVMDLSWRLRAALNLAVVTLAFLALWPTLHGMTGGKFPCPAYVRQHVEKKLVAGLDLRGGMRLVYTVDVDEAIKDKRNNFYEDMRVELTRVFGLHKDENERPTEETYKKLREKVDLAAPRQQANVITMTVKPGTDPTKTDERFLERFRSELGY
jgi:preprotein translocase subunit SecD